MLRGGRVLVAFAALFVACGSSTRTVFVTDDVESGGSGALGGDGGRGVFTAGSGGTHDPVGGNGGEACGDTELDDQNCGSCGHACGAGEQCRDGVCAAVPGSCKDKPPTFDCPCAPDNTLACNGVGQSEKLICAAGRWVVNGESCPAGYHCSQATGTCLAVIARCEAAGAGRSYCEPGEPGEPSTTAQLCDADLVSTSPAKCVGTCRDGMCHDPTCGDGKKDEGEACDDGNETSIDGCENDCTLSRVVSLALGNGFSCALTQGGFVRCWGANGSNQLGLGDSLFRGDQEPFELSQADRTMPAGPIDLGGKAVAITAGVDHACALLSDGSARCWGDNASGQLGLGNAEPMSDKVPRLIGPVRVAAASKITSISAGARLTCVVLDDGAATCFGQNAYGELGLGHTLPLSETQTPEQIGAISLGDAALTIGAGAESACALLASGNVRCWGSGSYAALGTGKYAEQGSVGDDELPSSLGDEGLVPNVYGESAIELKVGSSHSCLLLSNHALECWGMNGTGAIGLGDTGAVGDDESPAIYGPVFNASEKITAFTVGFGSTCVLVAGQGLRCFGLNKAGQAGYDHTQNLGTDPSTVPAHLPEVNVGAGRSVKLVEAGTDTTCVILDNDDVKCWGWNDRGQLGYGTVSSMPDYVGGTAETTPDKLAPLRLFGP